MITNLNGNLYVECFDLYEFLQEVVEASANGAYVLSPNNEHYPRVGFGGSCSVTLVPAEPEVKAPAKGKKGV